MNNHRFGKSSEKLDTDNQIAFLEVDGEIVFFNEAEAIASITDYDEDEPVKTRSKKVKGKTCRESERSSNCSCITYDVRSRADC